MGVLFMLLECKKIVGLSKVNKWMKVLKIVKMLIPPA